MVSITSEVTFYVGDAVDEVFTSGRGNVLLVDMGRLLKLKGMLGRQGTLKETEKKVEGKLKVSSIPILFICWVGSSAW